MLSEKLYHKLGPTYLRIKAKEYFLCLLIATSATYRFLQCKNRASYSRGEAKQSRGSREMGGERQGGRCFWVHVYNLQWNTVRIHSHLAQATHAHPATGALINADRCTYPSPSVMFTPGESIHIRKESLFREILQHAH